MEAIFKALGMIWLETPALVVGTQRKQGLLIVLMFLVV